MINDRTEADFVLHSDGPSKIGTFVNRKALAIIPQDPVSRFAACTKLELNPQSFQFVGRRDSLERVYLVDSLDSALTIRRRQQKRTRFKLSRASISTCLITFSAAGSRQTTMASSLERRA